MNATISHLATKADIESTKAEIERSSKEQLKWMIILFVPLYLTILGLIVTLLFKK